MQGAFHMLRNGDHMSDQHKHPGLSRQSEEQYLTETLAVIQDNIARYGRDVTRMKEQIDDMLEHFHDDNPELINQLENTITMHDHMKRALERNERAQNKPYFGRIVFYDETLRKEESVYIGKGGISKDATHWMVTDWRAPIANAYYENGLGPCSYPSPDGNPLSIDLKAKRTYEIEQGRLISYFDSEVIANDDLLTKYLARNKQAVLGEIVATIQKEQNDIIRKTPYHNLIVQGVAGSGKTTVAMHRISFILYNYAQRFKPDDFYIIGSNRILLNYITSVLPDLDVYGVRQMTMEQLFIRLLYEEWDTKKYSVKATEPSGQNLIKGRLSWFRDLETYCTRLEWNTIKRESVYLNPKQFVEGIRDGKPGVFDETNDQPTAPGALIRLIDGSAVERYIRQNPAVSVQNKINMLNERLDNKIKEEFLGKGVKYTEPEKKAIMKAYRGLYGAREWKLSIYRIYEDFLRKQVARGYDVEIPSTEFDVYDLAALAYLYKRIKETDVISEAHHVVIDEAQDFGMMAYSVLKFCIKDCTYTIMGDVSQNIHIGHGLNDWEELKALYLQNPKSSFSLLKKSYRNTVEISDFATNILHHGQFSVYPVEPIIRHGKPVKITHAADRDALLQKAASVCRNWQAKGLDTIAIICRDQKTAASAAKELRALIPIPESDPEAVQFGNGILVLPVAYTKGLEFDAVLILDPTKEAYPVDDGHAKLLYVAATRALHELCVLHTGNLTGLITDPLPEHSALQTTPKEAAPPTRRTDTIPAKSREAFTRPGIFPSAPSAEPVRSVTALAGLPTATAKNTTSAGLRTARQSADPLPVPSPTVSAHSFRTVQSPSPVHQEITFGDIPATEKLRTVGHPKTDCTIRWVTKQSDGLYFQSRYGILRLSPVGSDIVRVTFAKGNQIADDTHHKITVRSPYKAWMYRDSSKSIEFMTDQLLLQVDKFTGTIRYLTRDKKLLVEERNKESRLLISSPNGDTQNRLYLNWTKAEKLYGLDTSGMPTTALKGTARYISHSPKHPCLPFVLSDKGYGILIAADSPVFACDIPSYGSYIHTEKALQQDYYFITGKNTATVLAAYAYLLGK